MMTQAHLAPDAGRGRVRRLDIPDARRVNDDPSSPRPGRGERARVRGTESPLINRLEMPALGSGVDGGRPDDLIVDALLHHVRRPASRARYDEYRREHWRGNTHLGVRHGG